MRKSKKSRDMKKIKRVFLIVLDSVGIGGPMPSSTEMLAAIRCAQSPPRISFLSRI